MGIFFIDQFLEYLQYQRKFSQHTLLAYKNDLIEFQKFASVSFEILKPQEVKSEMVRSFVSDLIGKGLEPVSVRRKVSSLRSYFKYLQKEQINRIGNPDDFLACDRCGTVLDLCAVVIRHHTAAVDAPAQAHVLQFRIELG